MLENNKVSAEAVTKAKNSKSLTNGTSAFITGAQFTITDYSYESIDNSDNLFPALVTQPYGPLSVAALVRPVPVKPYVDKSTNEMVFARSPKGELNNLIRQIIANNNGKTNDEILPLIVEACKGKTFVVRECEYVIRETKYGDRARTLLHIDEVHA